MSLRHPSSKRKHTASDSENSDSNNSSDSLEDTSSEDSIDSIEALGSIGHLYQVSGDVDNAQLLSIIDQLKSKLGDMAEGGVPSGSAGDGTKVKSQPGGSGTSDPADEDVRRILYNQLKHTNLNNYARLTGIRRFIGVGIGSHPSYPDETFEPSSDAWLSLIETKTPLGELWDTSGRYQVVENYVCGPVLRQVRDWITQYPQDWAGFKQAFSIFYADDDEAAAQMAKIFASKRAPGEGIKFFASRLNDIVMTVKALDNSLWQRARDAASCRFLYSLPAVLHEKFLKKGYFMEYLTEVTKFLEKNPSLNLDSASIAKESAKHIASLAAKEEKKAKKGKEKEKEKDSKGKETVDSVAAVNVHQRARGRGGRRGRGRGARGQYYQGQGRRAYQTEPDYYGQQPGNAYYGYGYRGGRGGRSSRGGFRGNRPPRGRGGQEARHSEGRREDYDEHREGERDSSRKYEESERREGERERVYLCYNCHSLGHIARDCDRAFKCFTCGRYGHRSRDCYWVEGEKKNSEGGW